MDYNKRFNHFFKGKMTQAEAEEFSAWLDTKAGRFFLETKIQSEWGHEDSLENADWDKDFLLEKINREKYNGNEAEKSATTIPPRTAYIIKSPIPSWYRVAAILILIFGASILFYKINTPPTATTAVPAAVKLIIRANPAGVKSKFQLPDGTLVTLNSESTIHYREDFISNRKIELLGEAYFSVAKDSLHPFVVESKGLTTQALGTVFNVKAYEDERRVEVLLLEGKVVVNNIDSADAVYLDPGEKVSLKNEGSKLVKTTGNVTRDTQWISGILEFRSMQFQHIFKELERWYGVKIEVRGKLTSARGSGKFQEGETLENVLNVLSYSNNFTYEINKHKVVVSFNGN